MIQFCKAGMVFRNIHFNECTRKFQYWESIDILWKPGLFVRTHWDRLYSNNLNQSKIKGFPDGASGIEPICQLRHKRLGFDPWSEDPSEKEMATHFSIPAWRIPWTEKPAGLQSMGSLRVRHDWSDLAHRHIRVKQKKDREINRRFLFPKLRVFS